ncbi:MAG: ABC transporter ATP-binding protein [Bacteroidales bacterium]|jgi:ABC-2 type transport system ATP-binding protein|nr:ABC transporter ATP-binding protein [Bacteroidales bacterium]
MDQSVLTIKGLYHSYGTFMAVRDVNMDISRNGIYALLGENGAGKSTIINILCGVLKPTRGEIMVNGINLNDNPVEAKKNIGFAPQMPPLYNDLTVDEYLHYCAFLKGMDDDIIDESVDRTMDYCSLKNFRKRVLKNLSGGYRQRVSIAQSILNEPKIVVLDEPTNGLDPNQRRDVANLISSISAKSTIIMSTHVLSEVQDLCTHVFMIDKGSIVFDSSMDDFKNYINRKAITVKLMASPGVARLKELDGVEDAEFTGDCTYKIRYSDSRSAMDSIMKASIENSWYLTELKEEKGSMDEIFNILSHKL